MRTFLHTLLVAVLGGLFFYAGIHKILDPAAFAKAVNNYQLLPNSWINFVAVYLPWLELVVFAGLFHYSSRPAALGLIILMLLVFIVAQGMALAHGVDVSCGCFSTAEGSKKVGLHGILLNTGFLLAAILALRTRPDGENNYA